MSKAFSLIELLVSLTILALLFLFGMRFYKEYKESSYSTWTKAEMIDLLKTVKVAKGMDGFYHQYIYSMGYRPSGKQYAVVGTAADPSLNCCNNYPNLGEFPCERNWRSDFLYFNCIDSSLNRSTDNTEICNDSNYSYSCNLDPNDKGTELKALETSDFSTCRPNPVEWCNCEQFTVGSITILSKKMTLNNQNVFCEED